MDTKTRIPTKLGVIFSFAGDHQIHRVSLHDDVATSWDDTSIVLTLHLDQSDAEELFWNLLDLVPKLRADQR